MVENESEALYKPSSITYPLLLIFFIHFFDNYCIVCVLSCLNKRISYCIVCDSLVVSVLD